METLVARHAGSVDLVICSWLDFYPDQLCRSSSQAAQTYAAPKKLFILIPVAAYKPLLSHCICISVLIQFISPQILEALHGKCVNLVRLT